MHIQYSAQYWVHNWDPVDKERTLTQSCGQMKWMAWEREFLPHWATYKTGWLFSEGFVKDLNARQVIGQQVNDPFSSFNYCYKYSWNGNLSNF